MGTFDVEPEVGTIFVAQPLDYEMEQRYELRLVASDGKWENETLVVVQVVNRNDEAPVFSQTEYHAAVTEELTQLPVFILEVSFYLSQKVSSYFHSLIRPVYCHCLSTPAPGRIYLLMEVCPTPPLINFPMSKRSDTQSRFVIWSNQINPELHQSCRKKKNMFQNLKVWFSFLGEFRLSHQVYDYRLFFCCLNVPRYVLQ